MSPYLDVSRFALDALPVRGDDEAPPAVAHLAAPAAAVVFDAVQVRVAAHGAVNVT